LGGEGDGGVEGNDTDDGAGEVVDAVLIATMQFLSTA
jgi:hypothetical protein